MTATLLPMVAATAAAPSFEQQCAAVFEKSPWSTEDSMLISACQLFVRQQEDRKREDELKQQLQAMTTEQRDQVMTFAYSRHLNPNGENNCPVGSARKTFPCYCPAGWQMDSLATACLNTKEIKDNLSLMLALLPKEVKELLVRKVQDATRQGLAYEPTTDLKDLGVAFAADDDDVADYLYVNFIANTRNAAELFGKLKDKKLKRLLVAIMHPDAAFSPAKTEPKKPAPTPAQPPPPAVTTHTNQNVVADASNYHACNSEKDCPNLGVSKHGYPTRCVFLDKLQRQVCVSDEAYLQCHNSISQLDCAGPTTCVEELDSFFHQYHAWCVVTK